MDKNLLLKTKFVLDEDIKNITTYKNVGSISGAFYPKNQKELINTFKFLKSYKLPFIIIGNGSNLLIDDKVAIFSISTKFVEHKIVKKGNFLIVSSSTTLNELYQYCKDRSYGGFEKIAGVPATVGGAIINNASAYGQSIFDNLESIKVVKNEQILTLNKNEIKYSYHKTNLKNLLIISAKFNLKHKNKCEIINDYIYYSKLRKSSQPMGLSCGCVFKNPLNCKGAGSLIEQCHLKGCSINDAEISPVHANFIINKNSATFDDIYNLIKLCKNKVLLKYGIKLEEEVEIISKNKKF